MWTDLDQHSSVDLERSYDLAQKRNTDSENSHHSRIKTKYKPPPDPHTQLSTSILPNLTQPTST